LFRLCDQEPAAPEEGDDPVTATVVPLTRVDKKGRLYERPTEVEEEIRYFLDRPLDELVQHISNSTPSSSCLLYFARRFRPNGRSKLWDKILMTLLSRVAAQASRHVGDLPPQAAEEAVERVRMSFLTRLQKDHDSLDIFECVFQFAVKRLAISERRSAKVKAEAETSIEDIGTGEEGSSGYDALDAIRFRSGAQARPQGEAAADLGRILERLSDRERQAVIAVYHFGLAEKSKDPDELTAAKLLGVSDRMVRYLLASAREKAKDEGEHSS
jgi:DNA-directed RNA polymerase specialized sigma24 family protein